MLGVGRPFQFTLGIVRLFIDDFRPGKERKKRYFREAKGDTCFSSDAYVAERRATLSPFALRRKRTEMSFRNETELFHFCTSNLAKEAASDWRAASLGKVNRN